MNKKTIILILIILVGMIICTTLIISRENISKKISDPDSSIAKNEEPSNTAILSEIKKFQRDGKFVEDYGEYELIRDSLATTSPTVYHNKKYGFRVTAPCYCFSYDEILANILITKPMSVINLLDRNGFVEISIIKNMSDLDSYFIHQLIYSEEVELIPIKNILNPNDSKSVFTTYRFSHPLDPDNIPTNILFSKLDDNTFLVITFQFIYQGEYVLPLQYKKTVRQIVDSLTFDK